MLWKEDLKIVEAIAEHDFCFKRLPEMFCTMEGKIFRFPYALYKMFRLNTKFAFFTTALHRLLPYGLNGILLIDLLNGIMHNHENKHKYKHRRN